MLRKSGFAASIAHYRPSKVMAPQIAFVSCQNNFHTSTINQKSASEVVRENLEKLNKKIGKVAAEGIEKTQEATHNAGHTVSDVAQKAQSAMGHAKENAHESSADLTNKAQEAKREAQDKTHDAKNQAQDTAHEAKNQVQDKVHEVKNQAQDKAQELKKKANEYTQ